MRKPMILLIAAALLGLGACGDDDDATADEFAGGSSSSSSAPASTSSTAGPEEAAFTEAEADTVLEYDLEDYRFAGPTEAPAGMIFFKATNTGTENHELEVLDENKEALGEIVEMPPGESGELALEMAAGEYIFQCILETAEGQIHTELGMETVFTVNEAEGGAGGSTSSSATTSSTAAS